MILKPTFDNIWTTYGETCSGSGFRFRGYDFEANIRQQSACLLLLPDTVHISERVQRFVFSRVWLITPSRIAIVARARHICSLVGRN
jgi:hypothetical protein